jgi:Tol biopolymer transport system component
VKPRWLTGCLALMWMLTAIVAGCTQGATTPPAGSAGPSTASPSSSLSPAASPIRAASRPLGLSLTGRIVFGMDDDIYIIRPDGSGLRRLTSRKGPEFDPAWSPDGRQIVYRDSRRGINNDDEIYVMDADGSGQTNVSRDPGDDWGPAWSPDGERIAFSSTRSDGVPRIYLMDPDGSNVRRLTTIEGEYPAWSPDGTKIAFMGQAGEGGLGGTPGYELFVMNADGSDLRRLTDVAGQDGWPAWSPDGTLIAFSSTRDDHGQLGQDGPLHEVFVMRPDGTEQRRVSQEPGQLMAWSPDGGFILVANYGYVIRLDGSETWTLSATERGGGLTFADWLP